MIDVSGIPSILQRIEKTDAALAEQDKRITALENYIIALVGKANETTKKEK